jgi:hypothetical protein
MNVNADNHEAAAHSVRQWVRTVSDAGKLDQGLAEWAAKLLEGAARLDAKALELRLGGKAAPVAG